MKKIEMVKMVGGLVVSVGVGSIVGNVVLFTTPMSVGIIKKVCIGVGSFVLGSMASDKASEYTEEKIDAVAEQIKELVENGELN